MKHLGRKCVCHNACLRSQQAECESEVEVNDDIGNNECGSDDNGQHHARASNKKQARVVEIRADHISKIAAELLLDLS